ncbi:hypothetical protein NL676_029719 [Syzygium grande]|nr:hypothetical protein NL676_029719 [Syzygium grande]
MFRDLADPWPSSPSSGFEAPCWPPSPRRPVVRGAPEALMNPAMTQTGGHDCDLPVRMRKCTGHTRGDRPEGEIARGALWDTVGSRVMKWSAERSSSVELAVLPKLASLHDGFYSESRGSLSLVVMSWIYAKARLQPHHLSSMEDSMRSLLPGNQLPSKLASLPGGFWAINLGVSTFVIAPI